MLEDKGEFIFVIFYDCQSRHAFPVAKELLWYMSTKVISKLIIDCVYNTRMNNTE